MSDSLLEEVWVNFSSRKITIVSDVGETKEVQWKWDDEGREGFIDTINVIQKIVEPDRLTFCFTTHD
tara:strand:+ start:107 stop:307 length:201 start_codon:yes stop_codon:yes gene_type:complete